MPEFSGDAKGTPLHWNSEDEVYYWGQNCTKHLYVKKVIEFLKKRGVAHKLGEPVKQEDG